MQDIMNSLIATLIGTLLITTAGFSISTVKRFINKKSIKQLWQLHDIDKLVIVASNSTITDTGKYKRSATGLGQVRALSSIVTSLNRAYKNIDTDHIVLSNSGLPNLIENDLIAIGGPKNNQITEQLMKSLSEKNIFYQDENIMSWCYGENTITYEPIRENGKVVCDYGFVARLPNSESNKDSTMVIFSGGHTYGVISAAHFFTNNKLGDKNLKNKDIYIALVSVNVFDETTGKITVLQEEGFTFEEFNSLGGK